MVKVRKVSRDRVPAQQARRPVRAARKQPAPGGIVLGIFGWLCLAVLAVLCIVKAKKNQETIARIGDTGRERLAALQTSVQHRQKEISERKVSLGKQINEHIAQQAKLVPRVKGMELTVAEIEPQEQSLARTEEKLRESAGALQEYATLTGQGAEELSAKLKEAQEKKLALVNEYRRRYEQMKAVFEDRLARPDPEQLRQFYGSHRHTPFGPAAGFFAAEKLYGKKRSQDARRYYEDILKRYPDSRYATLATTRLAQVEARNGYEPFDPPIEVIPYRAPAFVRK